MKTTFSIILIALGATFCNGQQIDEDRMERDLKVAQNILSTLANNSDKELIFFNRNGSQGSYVKGYGVILNSSSRFPRTTYVNSQNGALSLGGKAYKFSGNEPVIISSSDGQNVIKKLDLDSLHKAQNDEWEEKMKTFLVDYSDLIGQLKPEDKIMVTSHATSRGGTWHSLELEASGRSLSTSGSSVEISKKDVSDYKAGKISRNEALKRIKVIKAATKVNVAQDVELLASIFQRLYKSDLSNTYYISGRVNYGNIPEFGVVFDMRVYSSSRDNKFHTVVTRQRSGLTQEERDDVVKEMYPEFLKQLKNNIIQYGRTVRSLKPDEILMFRVRLTECKGCGIPQNLELSIKASDLQAYDSGKINESTALSKISVKKTGEQ